MKNIFSFIFIFSFVILSFGQKNEANNIFAEAEEFFTTKKYDKALSKLELYDNLSNSSKEKSQILRIQIYREFTMQDKSYEVKYNNAVDILKKMYADGKKVNPEDLYRILKEQQDFKSDTEFQGKDNLSSVSNQIDIDGIKIGMNIDEVPSSVATNFNWEAGMKAPAAPPMNYAIISYISKKINSKGVQFICVDERTRKIISIDKIVETGKYKEKEKSGLSVFNQLLDDMKSKFGEGNITIQPPQIIKINNMNSESHIAYMKESKSVYYQIIYTVVNNRFTISQSLKIADFIKN